MKRHTTMFALTLGAFLVGYLTGGLRLPEVMSQSQAIESPQRGPWWPPLRGGVWSMETSKTTTTAWLYNRKTGKVYRVLKSCQNKGEPNGCLVPIPVIYGPQLKSDIPTEADDY